ncbi:MAG: hypothetical protein AAF986_05650 [Pseudomonadota bacterium]
MIRILLSLAVAAACFFGPLFADTTGAIIGQAPGAVVTGEYFAAPTADCVLAQTFSLAGDCAPNGNILGLLVTATVGMGFVSAALGLVGLLPLVGRVTSVFTFVAGIVALATFGMILKELLGAEGAAFTDIRWGAYAVGGFGVLTLLTGLGGMRGDRG